MRKPNLFIVGAPKCGTTAWARYLGTHPDISFSRVKEPHHFCTDLWHGPSITDPDRYLGLFDGSADARITAEASASYLYSEVAARNIRKYNPDAKIIIFVRDHDDYLFSWHNQLLYNGTENIADFETAWRLSGKRDPGKLAPLCTQPRFLDYRAVGALGAQVERYFAEFPEDQIRLFHLRDWSADPRSVYLEILRFLGLADDGRVTFERINEAKYHRARFVHRWIRHPPAPLRAAVSAARRFTGRKNLGLGELALRLEMKKGYRGKQLPEPIRDEIRAFYAADAELLEKRLWTSASRASSSAPDEALAASPVRG